MKLDDHTRWLDRLSDHLDGDLPPEESRVLEAHLAECASCRQALAELHDIVAQARALEPVEPERDLWPGIAGAVGAPLAGGEPRDAIPFPRERAARGRTGLFVTAPQLAAAAAALVILSTAATWWVGTGVPARGTGLPLAAPETPATAVAEGLAPPPELARELATLEAVLAEARPHLDPNTLRIIEKNLAVIQLAIDESVGALNVDPGNAFVRDHLERAYREKADFLREAASITGWEG